MPSTMVRNGKATSRPVVEPVLVEEEEEISTEPKLWSEFRNPYMFLRLELNPEAASAEGTVLETRKGEKVLVNLDFLVFKYAGDIQSLGLAEDKEGWLELCENLWEGCQEQSRQDKEHQLMESAEALHKLNPSKSVAEIYQQLKAITM